LQLTVNGGDVIVDEVELHEPRDVVDDGEDDDGDDVSEDRLPTPVAVAHERRQRSEERKK
jgi:hypothetical protein